MGLFNIHAPFEFSGNSLENLCKSPPQGRNLIDYYLRIQKLFFAGRRPSEAGPLGPRRLPLQHVHKLLEARGGRRLLLLQALVRPEALLLLQDPHRQAPRVRPKVQELRGSHKVLLRKEREGDEVGEFFFSRKIFKTKWVFCAPEFPTRSARKSSTRPATTLTR